VASDRVVMAREEWDRIAELEAENVRLRAAIRAALLEIDNPSTNAAPGSNWACVQYGVRRLRAAIDEIQAPEG
jgi:hypothetical protein